MSARLLSGGGTRQLEGTGTRLLQGSSVAPPVGGAGLTATPHTAYYVRKKPVPRRREIVKNQAVAVAVALLLLED